MKKEISKILLTAIAFLFFTGSIELKAQAPQNEIRIAAIGCICEIGNTGYIDLIATGDAGPFTFQWHGPDGYASTEQSPDDITVPGEYEVTVTNAYGCSVVLPRPGEEAISIGMCSFPDIIVIPQPSCPNQSVGALSLSVEYGEAPYTFAWAHDAGAVGPTVAQLPAGVYAVTVTDAQGCVANGEYEITDSEPINLEAALTHDCGMQHQGAVVVSASGGDGVYQYHWNNNWEDSQLAGLGTGVYKVTVTDSRGCRAMNGYTIENRELPVVSAQVEPARCLTALDGAITLEITTDNSVNYEVAWSNNATGTDLNGLAAGLYTATVTDDNGCQTVATFNTTPATPQDAMPYVRHVKIYAPQTNAPDILIYDGEWVTASTGCMFFTGGSLPISQTLLDAMVAGEQDLRIELEVSEMLNIISVSNNSIPIFNSSGNFGTNLSIPISENTVQQMLADGSLQETFLFAGVDFDDNPLLDLRAMSLNLTECVTVPQLQPNCEWQPPLSGMTEMDDVHVLTKPCMDVAIDMLANPSGGVNLKAVVSGDPQQYTYLWTKASSGESLGNTYQLTGIGPGRYCLKVSGPGGCIVELCENVCAPLEEDLQLAIDPPCPGQPNGSVCLGSASMLPLVVTWQLNGSSDVCLSGLYEGFEYCATVSELACSQEITYCTDRLDAISAVAVSLVQAIPSCPGMSNGRIQVSASGGRPPYTYAWSNGSHASQVTGLSAQAMLSVTVTDACGQSAVQSYTIPSYPTLALTGVDENPACGSSAIGSVRVYYQGGIAPFVFQWSGPQGFSDTGANPFIQNLSPGDYNVTITDACGQSVAGGPYTVAMTTYFGSFWVSDATITQVCGSESDGAIDLTVTNNNEFGTLSYLWSTGATTEDIAALSSGLYTVTISHSGGCSTVQHYQVFRAQIVDLHQNVSSSYCKLNDGAIAIAPEGVYLGNLTYTWSNGSHASQLTHLSPGDYTVTITYGFDDACTQVETFTVEDETTDLNIEVTNITGESEILDPDIPVGVQDGSITVAVSGGYSPYSFHWSNGATTQNLNDVGSGTYWLTVTDSRGCEADISVYVHSCNYYIPKLTSHPWQVNNLSAPDGGSIAINVVDGSPPFTFQWYGPDNFQSSSQNIENLTTPGTYCVTVTDHCGRTASLCRYMYATCPPGELLFDINNNCMEPGQGVSSLTFTGIQNFSSGNIYLEWSTGQTGYVKIGPGNLVSYLYWGQNSINIPEQGGVYSLTITDDHGCQYTGSAQFSADGQFPVLYAQPLIPLQDLDPAFEGFTEKAVNAFKVCETCGFENNGQSTAFYCNNFANGGYDDAPTLELRFQPFGEEEELGNPSAPNLCQRGGRVFLGQSTYSIEVLPNNVGIHVDNSSYCGCLFPPGIVSLPPYIYNLGYGYYDHFVFAKFEACGTSPDPGEGSNTITIDGTTLECPCGEEAQCLAIPITGTCSYRIICVNELGEHQIEEVQIVSGITYRKRKITAFIDANANAMDCAVFQVCGDVCNPQYITRVAYLLDSDCTEVDRLVNLGGDTYSITEIPWFETCLTGGDDQEVALSAVSNTGNTTQHTQTLEREQGIDDQQISMEAYPNPFSDEIWISLFTNEVQEIELNLSDNVGRKIASKRLTLEKGHLKVNWKFSENLSPGVYWLQLSAAFGTPLNLKLIHF